MVVDARIRVPPAELIPSNWLISAVVTVAPSRMFSSAAVAVSVLRSDSVHVTHVRLLLIEDALTVIPRRPRAVPPPYTPRVGPLPTIRLP